MTDDTRIGPTMVRMKGVKNDRGDINVLMDISTTRRFVDEDGAIKRALDAAMDSFEAEEVAS